MKSVGTRTAAAIAAALAGISLCLWAASVHAQSGTGSYDPWTNVRPGPPPPPPAPLPPASDPYPAYRPFFSVPRYYPGGGYYDLQRYGNPNSRDALDTCSYC